MTHVQNLKIYNLIQEIVCISMLKLMSNFGSVAAPFYCMSENNKHRNKQIVSNG